MHKPLAEKIKMAPDALEVYNRLRHLPFAVLLESGMLLEGLSRYSFIAADPFLVFKSRGVNVELIPGIGLNNFGFSAGFDELPPFKVLARLMEKYKLPSWDMPVPFWGGAAGYFSYDLGRELEILPDTTLDELQVPDICLGFYDWVVALDHLEKKVFLISTGLPFKDNGHMEKRAMDRLEAIKLQLLEKEVPGDIATYDEKVFYPGREDYYSSVQRAGSALESDFDRESYCRVVERAKEYIASGDIFQVNLAQRFKLKSSQDPFDIYRRLRKLNPSPMAAFLDFGDIRVCSSSPERFIKLTRGRVETCPIKGTRPRGRDSDEDQKNREELWNSSKDRAELVMIVDLERNDLGRVCHPGTIKVDIPEVYKIETYATVFHLVSRVVGQLGEGKKIIDLLGAAFPGGSITGAPKIRAMEIIEELEPVRRGIYCGSIGYLGFNGDADLNIVIRTLVFMGEEIHFHVGGGLTIDSNPLDEYYETLDKARALVMALGLDK